MPDARAKQIKGWVERLWDLMREMEGADHPFGDELAVLTRLAWREACDDLKQADNPALVELLEALRSTPQQLAAEGEGET